MLSVEDIVNSHEIIAVDAETTGHKIPAYAEVLKMPKGMRLPGNIIQLGCVKLIRDGDGWRIKTREVNGKLEDDTWESLINPEGPIKPASMAIHGIHPGALKKAPRFTEIRDEFEAFIGDSPLLAHGALNEIDYLNYEMRRAKLAAWDNEPYHEGRFLDTQEIARIALPNTRLSLDSICDRLWIDRSDRFAHHGALLDAVLTAEAFIKLTSGFVQEDVRVFSVST